MHRTLLCNCSAVLAKIIGTWCENPFTVVQGFRGWALNTSRSRVGQIDGHRLRIAEQISQEHGRCVGIRVAEPRDARIFYH